MTTNESSEILTPDFLSRLKEQLNVKNVYTDEQLHRAAFFFVTPTLVVASEIGAADPSSAAIITVANLLAGGELATFINSGILSVSAIDRYMTKIAEEGVAEEAKRDKSGGSGEAEQGIAGPDAGETTSERA